MLETDVEPDVVLKIAALTTLDHWFGSPVSNRRAKSGGPDVHLNMCVDALK